MRLPYTVRYTHTQTTDRTSEDGTRVKGQIRNSKTNGIITSNTKFSPGSGEHSWRIYYRGGAKSARHCGIVSVPKCQTLEARANMHMHTFFFF